MDIPDEVIKEYNETGSAEFIQGDILIILIRDKGLS